MKLHHTTTTLFSLLFLLLTATTHVHSLSSDGLSLLSLKSAVETSPSAAFVAAFSDWNDSDPEPCRWSGVSCDNATTGIPRVIGVSVTGRRLRGYIPSELGSLDHLRRLNLHGNLFNGVIPDQLFNATSLHSIILSNNNLSGLVPQTLGNCKKLQRLILAGNQFSGEIPAGIWSQLTGLVQLDLSDNRLSGCIPDDFGEIQSLSGTLNLSFNRLSGEIPKSLGDLPTTVSMDLRSNNLSGEIPQTGSFANQGPTAFVGNPFLCGFPLQRDCNPYSNTTTMSPIVSGDNKRSSLGRKGLSLGLILLISAADAMVVAFIGVVLIYLYWKRKDHSNGCRCTGTITLGGKREKSRFCFCVRVAQPESDSEKGSSGDEGGGELVAIDKGFEIELDELLRASAYVLGKNGLGIVYKVVLGNGVPVAVRRLGEQQRYKEFAAEVQAIGKVKHPNVVKLRAYYWAPDEKLLIYDFISNGNLANALRGRARQPSTSLTWSTRLKIAKGTARGLAYIHECSPRKFVHGDIKPSNILLDNEPQPYISDFGLNRLISITGNNPPSSSSSIGGGFMGGALPYIKHIEKFNTYRAPEARTPGVPPTQKWDVYSFGVVLLELLTGKSPEHYPPTTSTSMEVRDHLVGWVRKGFEGENPVLENMVDPMLLQEVHAKKEVWALFHVALACTEGDPEVRPRMKTISENLERIGT